MNDTQRMFKNQLSKGSDNSSGKRSSILTSQRNKLVPEDSGHKLKKSSLLDA